MAINRTFLLVIILLFMVVCEVRADNSNFQVFPKTETKPKIIPVKENTWVFILAGQSNMAGRGIVEPQDTITNDRVLSINKKGELITAKEPLHFYEPSMAGLDCGLSFGKELLEYIPDSISLLLIPTAVGGSAIHQWINDSTFRNVALFSNFCEKTKIGQKYGVIKGILWHQGESDAVTYESIRIYQAQLAKLFTKFREVTGNPDLPIFMGELGSFSKTGENWQKLNEQIRAFALKDKNAFVISTNDLVDKGDKVHFNSEGQRLMGKRFAKKFIKQQE